MTTTRAALALSLFTILASPALAAEEPPVVQAILKNWESQYHVKPSYKNLAVTGDGIVIEGLEAEAPGPEGTSVGGVKLTIGKLELKGVNDQGNGIFEIAAATYSDFKADVGNPGQGQGFTLTIPSGMSEGWYVKSLGDNPTPADTFRASMNIAHKSTSGPITISGDGQTVTADGYEVTWDGDVETGSGKSTFKVANIAIPENVLAMMDPSGALKQIGYTSLAFDLGGEGKFSLAADKLGFDFDMFYTGKDMGTLKLGAAAGEIPMALMSELQKEQSTDPGKLMPMVQGIQLSRLTFRFEDQSITKRILPLIAKMQGMDEPTLVATAGATAQLALVQLKNSAFTEKAVAAVNAFLKDPRSFTITAKPAQPVTVMQMMSLDPSNPGAAIDQLGVSVSAND